ncbi:MAG: divalent-cation tolerance protein CutA [Parvularculaceae bacterium]|nr:divalent-cation tolerance protein CutA [Parvularculaceae bacterium]
MNEIIIFYAVAPDESAAQTLAARLVATDAAACVNILPGVRSIYRWRGAVEQADEVAMIIKTASARADQVKSFVLAAHPHENPALLALPVDRVRSSEKFCAWIDDPR